GSYNNLGLVYDALGNPQKALEYFEKALTIKLATLGDSHPDVALSYNNLGAAYKALGNPQKALEYYEKALKILLAVYGEKHPHTTIAKSNLEQVLKEVERPVASAVTHPATLFSADREVEKRESESKSGSENKREPLQTQQKQKRFSCVLQ